MTFLLFLFGIFLALGMFLLTADLLRLPRLATQRAMLSVGRQEKKQARSVEALLMGWAIKLAPHIHMDEYRLIAEKNGYNTCFFHIPKRTVRVWSICWMSGFSSIWKRNL